ncbi:hypothetical protein SERLA73DRAFT_163251 [Serpula lacrymans var. lacrymans S7.3]|uniref:Cytochrome P450 n=2 Tax=Serpula lacrymans var. lacrymans TaxID=341189 RepID=F8QCG3_SERL3|nr:uncharacterized protein SERLADRAFT_418492 [Serpula lacrymans var. lacrymans S7.9]EGN93828.1 hypothetical protein SERLA73DRAFT_163251 [Serpula lacrymans var. lacrymans S7.3]EGO19197.1 hypothetical protein SERLADRAFT_418492 [Serpula lacrymans var. lacrymans S7.9]
MSITSTTTFSAIVIAVGLWGTQQFVRAKLPKNHPPIIPIPMDDILKNPRAAYTEALARHGPIIGVYRKGLLEFVVDDSLTQLVLTNDQLFSFEEGTAAILNLHYFFALFRTMFRNLDDVVQNMIRFRMQGMVEQIYPIFLQRTDDLLRQSQGKPIVLFDHTLGCVTEVMVKLVFGESYMDQRRLDVASAVAEDIAHLAGIYQNTSWFARTFPGIWCLYTWLRVIFVTIIFGFLRVFGPQLWQELRTQQWDPDCENNDTMDENMLHYIARRHASKDGSISITSTLKVMGTLTTLLFASIHQTASVGVWVLFELAIRPEYLVKIREELHSMTDPITNNLDAANANEALKKSIWLDCFIREVMRTKGDTLSSCRMTTQDVTLAGYTVPKGNLVFPLTSLSHENPVYHGPDAHVFRPERWHGQETSLAVTGSISYHPFGLGRWACPGRVLAVAEMKMIVWSIVSKATPRLKDNTYQVVDPLNVTSVPPVGELILEPFSF